MTRMGRAVSTAVADERQSIVDFLVIRAANLRVAGNTSAYRIVMVLAKDIDDAKHRASPNTAPRLQCCCSWDAAVSGEYPEFGCAKCPVHQASLGEMEQCGRHAKEQTSV